MVDALVALAVVLIAVLPLVLGFRGEARLLRDTYQRAVAMEIVDGELEALAAGGGAGVAEGSTHYTVRARAAVNLPPGAFKLTRNGQVLRLEWQPAGRSGIGAVVREATVK